MFFQNVTDADSFGNSIRCYHDFGFPQPHIHPSAELLYVERGRVELTVNGRAEILHPGDTALVLPNQLHSFVCDDGSFYWVHVFTPTNAPMFFTLLGTRVAKCFRYAADADAVRYYCAVCLAAPPEGTQPHASFSSVSEGRQSPIRVKSALYGILAGYLESELIERDAAEDSLFGNIMQYIAAHCTEDVNLTTIAAAFGYEPHYLCRYMKKITDINIRWLINRCRIDKARAMLDTVDRDITEISLEVGYGCLRTFNRVFREIVGCTPSEYKKRGRA